MVLNVSSQINLQFQTTLINSLDLNTINLQIGTFHPFKDSGCVNCNLSIEEEKHRFYLAR
jgi:hypothetical protein